MKNVVWDPLRKKEVALTPEERVRQWCIGILRDQMGVPVHMMMSEAGFKLGDKQFRADILVYDRQASPLMVVECKRPEVELTQEVLDQAIRYNMVLDVRYMIITNGTKTYMCGKEGARYVFLTSFPVYSEMLE
jgi:type I site-specific restriction endonuclease